MTAGQRVQDVLDGRKPTFTDLATTVNRKRLITTSRQCDSSVRNLAIVLTSCRLFVRDIWRDREAYRSATLEMMADRRKRGKFYEEDRYEYRVGYRSLLIGKQRNCRKKIDTSVEKSLGREATSRQRGIRWLCESGSRLHNSGESAKNDTPRGSIETGKDPRKWRWRARGAPAAHQRRRVLVARLLSGLLLSGEAKWKSLLLAGTRSIYKQRV